jgi:hypothetical protein
MRSKHQGLALLVSALVLALVAAGSGLAGGTHSKASTASGPSGWVGKGNATVGSGGGFGETYKAPVSTLVHGFFRANLLPANKTARNIALASVGRSTKTVNYALAL